MPESYLHVLPVHRTHTYSGRPRIRRLRHLFVLGLPITFLFFWLIRIAARDKWVRDFGYITRPLWDKSANEDRPQTTIPHYDVSGSIIPGELCTLHGWSNSSSTSSHSGPPKVYDAFLYSIELDLLEIRLHELWDVVDTFVIIEATRSFSGDLRHDMTPLSSLLASPQARLNWAGPKIKYELVDDLSPSPKDPFDNERHLRQRMNLLLSSAGVRPNDIILMSDLDEIPTPHTITLLKQCSNWPSPLHLQMRNYLYSFEFPVQDDGYWRPKAVRWGGPGSSYNHAKGGDIILANAGWHCSWCFRYIEDIQFKMTVRPNSNLFASKSTHFSVSIKNPRSHTFSYTQGYSHNDRLKGQYQLDPARINKHTCDGSDIFDMYPVCLNISAFILAAYYWAPALQEAFSFHDLYSQSGPLKISKSFTDIPDWLVRHPTEYEFLLPGGCKRKHRPTSS